MQESNSKLFAIAFFTKVHYQRSVKRVSERVNKSGTAAYLAFNTIGYAIVNAKRKEDVESLFHVLCGEEPLSTACGILGDRVELTRYSPDHNPEKWKSCSHWCSWWMRPNHLSK